MLKLHQRPQSGIWRIRGTHFGVVIDRSARTRSRAEAEKIRALCEAEIFARVHGLPSAEDAPDHRFSDAALSWVKSGGNTTLYFYFDRVVKALADQPLKDLTRGVIDQTAAQLFPTQKPSTINRGYYALVSVILNHAADERMMTPMRIKPLKVKKTRPDWHSPEIIERALIAAKADGHGLFPVFSFFIGTGARTSEVMRLTWDDVAQDNSRVTFWDTKSGRARSVDLCPRTQSALPPRGAGAVFKKEGGQAWDISPQGRYDGFRQKLSRFCDRHDLPRIKPHSLRHSWASWQYACAPDPLRLMARGGWSSLKMVENYAHIATPDLARRVTAHGWFLHEFKPEAGNIRAIKT